MIESKINNNEPNQQKNGEKKERKRRPTNLSPVFPHLDHSKANRF